MILLPASAFATDYSIDSSTFLRLQQSAVPGFDKQFLAPATEYLTIDASKVGVDGLPIHFSGWGNAYLGNVADGDNRYRGLLSYFYLDYRLPTANAQLKAGRFYVVDGMGLQQVDGAGIRTDLPFGFTASVYGGIPSKLDYQYDNTGDWIAGGRVSKKFGHVMELGVSGLYETGLTTVTTVGIDPATPVSNHNFRQLVGGDVWFSPCRMVEVTGHTYYNTTTAGITEDSYLLTVKPADMVVMAADYSDENPKDYFSSTNLPSLFNPTESDRFRKYGGLVTVSATKNIELSADYHRYNRKATGNSNRYGVDLRGHFAENKVRTGLSYHYVDGAPAAPVAGVTPATDYQEVRGYAMYDAHAYVISMDGIADFYNEKVNGRDTSYEILASAGYRFLPNLLLSSDVSYARNPEYDSEVKGLMKLVYTFTSDAKGAQK
jgi:hypothetical protein